MRMFKRKTFLILIFWLVSAPYLVFSQSSPANPENKSKPSGQSSTTSTVTPVKKNKPKLIQFSGVVVESDSLKPLPFTSILVKGTSHGTVSDYYGFFTLVAQAGDEIEFASVAYKDASYIIPDTLTASNYSIIQVMRLDTITLAPVTIYPWPTREEFKKAFLKLDVP
ncbi:MAG: carboxypeptidase-like regulatory domain-containing protein, partial [Bacteroidia bacterium]